MGRNEILDANICEDDESSLRPSSLCWTDKFKGKFKSFCWRSKVAR